MLNMLVYGEIIEGDDIEWICLMRNKLLGYIFEFMVIVFKF